MIGFERGSTERAIKIEVVEPTIKAILVEHVAAIEFPHLLPVSQPAQAHDTIGALSSAAVFVGESLVQVELLGEYHEGGEAGTQESDVVHGGGLVRAREKPNRMEETQEESSETADALGDYGYEEKRDRI
ncbi:hypothetical protein V6N13_012856 [Hibiscus sabdariffa]|uniref:Uncharacterized protein n=1 Tax=Hibiscus sabdariffa TaxID=183260 RepID=A0ABR2SH88_9ROSI